MTEFSDSAIRRAAEHFDEKTLRRGLRYAMEGRVHLVKADCWPIVAKVRGTQSYVVTVDYTPANQYLRGECSCPVALDCKHAVATAIVAFEREEAERYDRREDYQAQAVGKWLARLGRAPTSDTGRRPSKNVVAFVLDEHEDFVGLSFHRTSVLKRGGYSRSSRIASIADSTRRVPAWMSSEELRLISTARALARADVFESTHPISSFDDALFRDMCATGRLFWGDVQSLPLQWGPERTARLGWHESEDEPEEFRLRVGDGLQILPASSTLYVDLTTRTMGLLDVGVPPPIVETLVRGPAVPSSMLATAEKSLRSVLRPQARAALFPGAASPSSASRSALQPQLLAAVGRDQFGPTLSLQERAAYGRETFRLAEWSQGRTSAEGSEIVRDMAEEGRFAERLEDLLCSAPMDVLEPDGKRELLRAAQYLAQTIIPTLISEGWQCELHEDFPAALPVMDADWVEELHPVSEGHWFSMSLGVSIGGKTVQLLPILLHAIRDGRINFEDGEFGDTQPVGINLRLPSGELVYVSRVRLQRWLRPLIELRLRGLNKEDQLLVPGVSAVSVADALPGPFAESSALANVRERLASLIDLRPRREGKAFVGELRGYQRQGLAWLRFLHDSGFGGLLCDDMGLGKTVQLLAFIDGLRASRVLRAGSPVLVVAPRSVVGNWHLEAQRFTPRLTSSVHLGPDRCKLAKELCQSQVVITSYQTLLRDIEIACEVPWTSVIFDEAQALKNPDTKLRRAVSRLRSSSRFCVTGTPIENHLGELWSQVDLIMPGLVGSKKTFQVVFRKPIEKQANGEVLELLRQRIRPFLLRRRKSDVEIDLPEKTEIVERVALEPAQRDLYESLRLILDKEVRGALKSRGVQASSLIILDALLRLRQCCCDPRLVNIPEARKAKKSAKLERLMAMLDELADAGRYALVFSQFTSMLELIEGECKRAGISYLTLTGATRDRERVVRRFQDGEVPVFLISLKAGGVGLNLTRADTVIHYDPWWNPAAEHQATDRAHRIGQTKNLMVYKLVAQGTLEERICVMQHEKQQLTDAALRNGGLSHLGAEDLRALFQSL